MNVLVNEEASDSFTSAKVNGDFSSYVKLEQNEIEQKV